MKWRGEVNEYKNTLFNRNNRGMDCCFCMYTNNEKNSA